MPGAPRVPRVLFVNGGILGLSSYHDFLQLWLPRQSRIEYELLLLTEHLSPADRLIRRLLTQRLWRDGSLGLANLDFARFRAELNAGFHARRLVSRSDPRRFDVLHFHRTAVAYGSLDVMERVPTIISMDCTQDCVIDAARSGLERWTYAPNVRRDGAVFTRAAAIVSTSAWAARTLQARYPHCTVPVHVLPNPVLLDHFDRGWPEQRWRRAAAGALPLALFMGGDFPRKGGFALLDAWERGGLHEVARLEIVSDWPIQRTLPRGVTRTRGIRHHTAAWRDVWHRADFFVMPTRNEAFGLVFQEAAAAGLPAIGTRHNAVPEIILDRETGLLVDVGDADQLVSAMRTLAADAALRHRLGTRGREHIEQVADPGRHLDTLLGIIESAAVSSRRAG